MKNNGKKTTSKILNSSFINIDSILLNKDYSDNIINKNLIINLLGKQKKIKTRKFNSLEELAKKFIQCVYEEQNIFVDLRSVIDKINVKKRRIYDITNVLEGKSIYNFFNNNL